MAGYHVSSLKPNEVSTNLRLGTFALKWPEETNKPVVIGMFLRNASVRLTDSLQRRLPLLLIYPSIPRVSICFAWIRWRKYVRSNLPNESIRLVCFLFEGNRMFRHSSDSRYANGFRSPAPSSNVNTRTSAWRMSRRCSLGRDRLRSNQHWCHRCTALFEMAHHLLRQHIHTGSGSTHHSLLLPFADRCTSKIVIEDSKERRKSRTHLPLTGMDRATISVWAQSLAQKSLGLGVSREDTHESDS